MSDTVNDRLIQEKLIIAQLKDHMQNSPKFSKIHSICFNLLQSAQYAQYAQSDKGKVIIWSIKQSKVHRRIPPLEVPIFISQNVYF